jgi:hypothetical protein
MLTDRVADWISSGRVTDRRVAGRREVEGLGHGTRRDVMGICAEAKECDGKHRAILAVAPAVSVPASRSPGKSNNRLCQPV